MILVTTVRNMHVLKYSS